VPGGYPAPDTCLIVPLADLSCFLASKETRARRAPFPASLPLSLRQMFQYAYAARVCMGADPPQWVKRATLFFLRLTWYDNLTSISAVDWVGPVKGVEEVAFSPPVGLTPPVLNQDCLFRYPLISLSLLIRCLEQILSDMPFLPPVFGCIPGETPLRPPWPPTPPSPKQGWNCLAGAVDPLPPQLSPRSPPFVCSPPMQSLFFCLLELPWLHPGREIAVCATRSLFFSAFSKAFTEPPSDASDLPSANIGFFSPPSANVTMSEQFASNHRLTPRRRRPDKNWVANCVIF